MGRKLRQVALFFPPTLGYFADVVMGIQEYARSQGNWAVEVCETVSAARASTKHWRPDGILVNIGEGQWSRLIRTLNVPTVQIGGTPRSIMHRILSDDAAIGRLAATHLLDRGFRHFAFCGYDHLEWSTLRVDAYMTQLKHAGRSCETLYGGLGEIGVWSVATLLAPWITRLPKPVGIFACHDRVATLLIDACHYLGVKVPDEVAILGVDNNPQECAFASPPLSSIMGSARRIGYQASEQLHALMRGVKLKAKPMFVAPAGVAARASTDVFAADDPDVVAAVRFIQANAGVQLDVRDVAAATLTSRRMLERKFRAVLQRSPREQILKTHVEQAKSMLIDSGLTILEVALRCGFPSGSKFSYVFKRETGLSPSTFRNLYGRQPQDRIIVEKSAADPNAASHR